MRVLASPASCKGVLSAVEAAMALAAGMRTAGLEAEELPVADGGEGTAEVFAAAFGGGWRVAAASDPLGRPIRASYLVLEDGSVVVEAADAVGLRLLDGGELDPMRASSRGLGELLLAAAAEASGPILVGLGDTATVDGGAGLLQVVGDRLAYDHDQPDAFSGQDYFPEKMGRHTFYDPPDRGFERDIRKRLDYWAKLRRERAGEG